MSFDADKDVGKSIYAFDFAVIAVYFFSLCVHNAAQLFRGDKAAIPFGASPPLSPSMRPSFVVTT
jgi:hypothetical protein